MKLENFVLRTGDDNLNKILSMDEINEDETGIKCNYRGDKLNSPVTLILGEAGSGKTTLAVQIACHNIIKEIKPLPVFYYSLEQSVCSLESLIDKFAFLKYINKYTFDFAEGVPEKIEPNLYFCHLSPMSISGHSAETTFEDRFGEICHMIDNACDNVKKAFGDAIRPVFIIDSLNAIALSKLERNDIYRLFTIFRSNEIPLIITAESK
ncbi:MAG: hypothetical protein ACYC25_15375, partial [Paludibacter sp.]